MSQKETKHYMTKVNLEMLPPDEECKKNVIQGNTGVFYGRKDLFQYCNSILPYNSTEFIRALFYLCFSVSVQISMKLGLCFSICFLLKKS